MPPELTDIRSGDYRIPDLRLESTEQRPLNKYGQTFPREHRPVQYSLLTMLQKLFPRMEQRTSVKAAAPGNPADESRKTGVLAQKSLRFFTPAIENSFPHNSPKPANNTTGNLAQGEEKQ